MVKFSKLPSGTMSFSSSISDRVNKIEDTLDIDGDNGICKKVSDHDGDINFFKRFLKFAAWFLGIGVTIFITIFGIILKLNIDLIREVAVLTSKLIQYTGG